MCVAAWGAMVIGACLVWAQGPAFASHGSEGAESEGETEPESDLGEELYRRVRLPPFLERRVQSLLHHEWRTASAHADKVGLRRMSRSRYRRALVALDRSTNAQIRALIGPKHYASWSRARAEASLKQAGAAPPTSRSRKRWTRDRCAGVARLLRGTALSAMTPEEVHVWIHDHARRC